MKFCGLVEFVSLYIPTCRKGDPGDVWGNVARSKSIKYHISFYVGLWTSEHYISTHWKDDKGDMSGTVVRNKNITWHIKKTMV